MGHDKGVSRGERKKQLRHGLAFFSVATRNLCHYRLGPISVATHFLVSRHGLTYLGSRPEFGVATKPEHSGWS